MKNLPAGFLFSGIHSGIKKNRRRKDLGLVYSCLSCSTVFLFTTNDIKAYSLQATRANCAGTGNIRAVLVNSGNANCCSGKNELKKTQDTIVKISRKLSLKPQSVGFLSTGIIGKPLDFKKMHGSFPALVKNLAWKNAPCFAEAILTTDTKVKTESASIVTKKGKVNILGIAKGAGMIYPNMATMLAFLFTDAAISQGSLKKILKEVHRDSFYRINIDSSKSTNDTFVCMANGSSEIEPGKDKKLLDSFKEGLRQVSLGLAKKIVQDAEGSTKLVQVKISGLDFGKARKVFEQISGSILFKASLYGRQCNWGRIIQSLGQAGLGIKENNVRIAYFSGKDEYAVFARGKVFADNKRKIEKKVLRSKDVGIGVKIYGKGTGTHVFYTCDISNSYVKINAGLS